MMERIRAQERLDMIEDGLAFQQRAFEDRQQRDHVRQLGARATGRRRRRGAPVEPKVAQEALAAAGIEVTMPGQQ